MRAKFMEIVFLTKAEKSNFNASGTEGNITSLKKTTEIDDTQRVFVSGTSLKYSIKEYLREVEEKYGIKLSPLKSKSEEAQITTECDPKSYIDDDLFGYLDTSTDKKRVAPVKTNGMISLFSYRNDLNRGVRFDPEGQNHSLYDIEIVTSVFRSNWAIELDRIGKETVTINKSRQEIDIGDEEREKRIKVFLNGLFNLWSRVKQTNYLTDISPRVITIVLRDDKALTVADRLRIDTNYNLDIEALRESLRLHKDSIKEFYLGYSASFINNVDEVKNLHNGLDDSLKGKVKVMEIAELKEKILGNEFKFFTQ